MAIRTPTVGLAQREIGSWRNASTELDPEQTTWTDIGLKHNKKKPKKKEKRKYAKRRRKSTLP